jgi:hypothetical protein
MTDSKGKIKQFVYELQMRTAKKEKISQNKEK